MLMQCNPANSATLNISINHYILTFKYFAVFILFLECKYLSIVIFLVFFKTYICLFAGKFSVESKISARPTSPKVRESKKLD